MCAILRFLQFHSSPFATTMRWGRFISLATLLTLLLGFPPLYAVDSTRIHNVFHVSLPVGQTQATNNMTICDGVLYIPRGIVSTIDFRDINHPVVGIDPTFSDVIRINYYWSSRLVYVFTPTSANTFSYEGDPPSWQMFNSYQCPVLYGEHTLFSYTPHWIVQTGDRYLLNINCSWSTRPGSVYGPLTARADTASGPFESFKMTEYSIIIPILNPRRLEIRNVYGDDINLWGQCSLPFTPRRCDAQYVDGYTNELNYVYVTDEDGLTVVDAHDKSTPFVVAHCEISQGALDVDVRPNGYAFLIDGLGRINVVDIHNPLNPQIIAINVDYYGYTFLEPMGEHVFAYNPNGYVGCFYFDRMPSPEFTANFPENNQEAFSTGLPSSGDTGNESPLTVEFDPITSGANPTTVSLWHATRYSALTNWYVDQSYFNWLLEPNKSVNRLWYIQQTGGTGFHATVLLRFTAAQLPAGITNPNTQLTRAVQYKSNGDYYDRYCHVVGPDGNGVYTATINNVSEFSLWGLGTNDSYLSVEMTSFLATAGDNSITIQWVTETEINNSHFNLYRAVGVSGEFEQIAHIAGNGTVAEAHNYTYTDTRVTNGVKYHYRISDVDVHGVENFYPEIVTASPHPNAHLTTPGRYALIQNYPNPFNAATVIKYSIREPGEVDLTVFDALGRQVSRLVHENLKPGEYRVTFSAEGVPSGTYYYRLRAQRFTSMRSMVVVK